MRFLTYGLQDINNLSPPKGKFYYTVTGHFVPNRSN